MIDDNCGWYRIAQYHQEYIYYNVIIICYFYHLSIYKETYALSTKNRNQIIYPSFNILYSISYTILRRES